MSGDQWGSRLRRDAAVRSRAPWPRAGRRATGRRGLARRFARAAAMAFAAANAAAALALYAYQPGDRPAVLGMLAADAAAWLLVAVTR